MLQHSMHVFIEKWFASSTAKDHSTTLGYVWECKKEVIITPIRAVIAFFVMNVGAKITQNIASGCDLKNSLDQRCFDSERNDCLSFLNLFHIRASRIFGGVPV